MTESDARAVLLLRAYESAPGSAWSDADSAWASAEARRVEGEHSTFRRYVVRRALLAVSRLTQRDPKLGAALAALQPRAWLGWVVALIAFILGFASDAIGPNDRINILAPPMLALLVWNLVVYLALLVRPNVVPRPFRRRLMRLGTLVGAGTDASPARFAPDWAALSGPLYGARLAVALHAAAAALVIGAIFSMYLRGIAFEYRAGWDSTFLDAQAVHRLLSIVLGPAAHLSGIALPGVDQLAQLRFSVGSGENAARWIHLYAITMGLAIVLPRMLLALLAAWRASALTREFPLQLDGDYFERLRRSMSGEAVEALVLPYSYRLPADAQGPLRAALERSVGPNVTLSVAPSLPHGAEDELRQWPETDATSKAAIPVVVAVFPLTATPERETHGAFVRSLASQRPGARLIVLVDEAEFRRRFTGTEGERRLAERRGAWERMLAEIDATPMFADLAARA